jgi:hypothetical protein
MEGTYQHAHDGDQRYHLAEPPEPEEESSEHGGEDLMFTMCAIAGVWARPVQPGVDMTSRGDLPSPRLTGEQGGGCLGLIAIDPLAMNTLSY